MPKDNQTMTETVKLTLRRKLSKHQQEDERELKLLPIKSIQR